MLVMSSPSGAGKTTIVQKLLKLDSKVTMSVSVTTRKPRIGEKEGKDYFFISKSEYNLMVKTGALLEHAKVFDNFSS